MIHQKLNFFKCRGKTSNKKDVEEERVLELAIEAGATECFSYEDFHEIHCDKSSIYSVKKKLEENITNFISTELEWIPNNKVVVSKENLELAIATDFTI